MDSVLINSKKTFFSVGFSSKSINIVAFFYLSFFLFSLIVAFLFEKTDSHLFINKYNTPFFDLFFKYITFLGDGLMFAVLFVCYLVFKKRNILPLLFSSVLTLVLVAFFKKVVYKGTPRPVKLIGSECLHLVEGVKIAYWNSFPSGHTTTAFAIATILVFTTRNLYLQLIYLVLAILTGLSRVYLSQHFLIDVLAGSALGVAIGMLSIKIAEFIYARYIKFYATKKLVIK